MANMKTFNWSSRNCAIVDKYLTTDMPATPYPWHPVSGGAGTSTLFYARLLLDALAGDERRGDLRRAFRLYKLHEKADNEWRSATYWILVRVCLGLCETLPFSLLRQHLNTNLKRGEEWII